MKNLTKNLLPLLLLFVAFNTFAQEGEKKKSKGGKKSTVSEGTVITGDVSAISDFDFDGKLIGNFDSEAFLAIGKTAEMKGNIKAADVEVEGKYEGEMTVSGLLVVTSKASVKGKTTVGLLEVEKGATFIATNTMPDLYEQGFSKKK